MDKFRYYKWMHQLAAEKRREHSLITTNINLSTIRKVYKTEGIIIDSCKGKLRKLKAAYFCDDDGCSVLLNMKLPKEPRLFAMLHELKHHYVDQDNLMCCCQEVYDSSPVIEIGAEVFAAEFIFPEEEFREYVSGFLQTSRVKAEDIVHMKYHSPAHVSYQFLQKTLERLKYIEKGEFKNIQFMNLHAQIYGKSYYRSRRT